MENKQDDTTVELTSGGTMENKPNDTMVEISSDGETVRMTGNEFYRVAQGAGKHLKMEKQSLLCQLNESELIARGHELAEALRKLEQLEDAETARRKEARISIEGQERLVTQLAETVIKKSELRDVMVVSDLASTAKGMMVAETRTDTGEVLSMRPATATEIQPGML